MIGALLYLQAQSFKNMALARLRRLRRPKYLVGAIFSIGYFGLIFARPFLMARGGSSGAGAAAFSHVPDDLWEFLAACALFLFVALAWLLPQSRTGLVFSEAEIAFLFPAPVSRKTLVRFKLLKMQMGILLTATFLALFSLRYGGWPSAGRRAAGMWVVFSLIGLHSLGVSFTQLVLFGRHASNWRRRSVIILVALAAVTGAVAWIVLTVPPIRAADLLSPAVAGKYVRAVIHSTPSMVLLAPFRLAVRPALAVNGMAFLRAIGPALLLLVAHYFWVVRMDVAFEEASLEASRLHAARVARMRGPNRWAAARPRRKSRSPFPLSAKGPPAVAFLWKNLISAGQLFSLRIWGPVFLWGLYMGWVFNHHSQGHQSPWYPIIGTSALVLAIGSILIGPQMARQDFRQDMAAVDLLKTYPISGRQLAFGQVLAPLVILTVFQWIMLGIAAFLFTGAAESTQSIFKYAACLALIAPAMNLIMLLLPNAAALLYPGWFQTAQTSGRDLEVMGQRMLLAVALLAVFALAVAPAVGAFVWIYLVGPWLVAPAIVLPAATIGATMVLGIEGLAGLAALGYLFERFDPSAETA